MTYDQLTWSDIQYQEDHGVLPSRGWVSGVDFDPHDHDQMEIMALVWEKERYESESRRVRELKYENERLRAMLRDAGITVGEEN